MRQKEGAENESVRRRQREEGREKGKRVKQGEKEGGRARERERVTNTECDRGIKSEFA